MDSFIERMLQVIVCIDGSNLIALVTGLITCSICYFCYTKNKKDTKTSKIDSKDKNFSAPEEFNKVALDSTSQKSSKIQREMKENPRIREEEFKVTQQDFKKADELISILCDKSRGGRKSRLVKRNEFVHKPSGISVSSWKMNEWDYKKHRTPTQARGLFTRVAENNRHEIVIRGYDKFFNTGEVPETKWENIATQTKGPYEVTIKENGCIIFISGLPGGFIIVTSKHSMGEREDGVSHAVVGEQWLDNHLKKANKSKQDLAKFLYKHRSTAVAELCDDQFEEHVLPYASDRSGLYLHGINLNTVDLKTWPSEKVENFANEWGFRKVNYYMKQTAEGVKNFTDSIKEKGSLDDRPIEGFVIRTKLISTGQDFFFKVKYDEPYLMYREWREMTKALLNNKKPRVTYALSQHYLEWVKEKIKTQPNLFKGYKQNHGIFQVREMFLEYWNNKGSTQTVAKISQGRKTLMIPVATIGCGKTTLSLALASLFSFGHVQNDNIVGKKQFHSNINKAFESHDVVIADRNNQTKELRETLIEAMKKNLPNIRIVAIYWNHEYGALNEIFQITSKRVLARGENHQSLTPAKPNYEEVMWSFLKSFEHLDSNNNVDNQFDYVIDLDVTNDIKTNLDIIIKELKPIISIEIPSEDAIKKALEDVNHYRPTVRKFVGKVAKVVYYGIKLDFNVQDFLTKYYDDHPNENSETFKRLVQNERIGHAHHITLIHTTELKKNPSNEELKDIWKQCEKLCKDSPQVKVHIDKIIFNPQIMALVANRIDPPTIRTTNKIIHTTVGTVDNSVKPIQSNTICELAFLGKEKHPEIGVINLEQELVINGTVKAYY